jgi:hypothetical protein
MTRADRLPERETSVDAPNGVTLWSSIYARLVLWPVPGIDASAIQTTAREAQAWFDEMLVQDERNSGGSPIDGYLVLALPGAPDDSTREEVRRLELSSQVCRKHLIWNSPPTELEDGGWQRVADITVVGFPDAEIAPGPELEWPQMDSQAKALWDDLVSLGVPAMVLKDGSD